MPCRRRCCCWASARWERTNTTPRGRSASNASSHRAGGRCAPSSCAIDSPMPAAEVTASTPRRISIAQPVSNSWNTRSTRPPLVACRRARRWYWWRSRLASTRALVPGATSPRPLRTLDTVATETPTSLAMVAMVVEAGGSSGRCSVIAASYNIRKFRATLTR
jgi:hypothetical protein